MASTLKDIKDEIENQLDTLKENGTIHSYESLDWQKDILQIDVGSYPHVLLVTPSIESEQLDNQHSFRTYNFSLDVINKRESLEDGVNTLEQQMEDIMNHFETVSADLDGKADGGILPTINSPQTVRDNTGNIFVLYGIELRVRASHNMGF